MRDEAVLCAFLSSPDRDSFWTTLGRPISGLIVRVEANLPAAVRSLPKMMVRVSKGEQSLSKPE